MSDVPTSTAKKTSETGDASAPESAIAKPKATVHGPHIVMRVLIGFSGLSLLVGFFLPWLSAAPVAEGALPVTFAGYDIALGSSPFVVAGYQALWLIPALGAALSAAAFMGFRWAGQVAIGVAVALIGFALYVLLQMFVQHTALGLWIVAGGTFVVLLLGVITWMLETRRKASRPALASVAKPDAAS